MHRLSSALPAEPDRGSVAIWMITTALTMMLLLGLAVDLGGQVQAKQRAQDIAAQAARAGGQQLQGPAAILGTGAVVDPTAAVAAATTYLAGVDDVSGIATMVAGQVVVDTKSTYTPVFLTLIGIDTLTVTGHATVQTTRTVGGVER